MYLCFLRGQRGGRRCEGSAVSQTKRAQNWLPRVDRQHLGTGWSLSIGGAIGACRQLHHGRCKGNRAQSPQHPRSPSLPWWRLNDGDSRAIAVANCQMKSAASSLTLPPVSMATTTRRHLSSNSGYFRSLCKRACEKMLRPLLTRATPGTSAPCASGLGKKCSVHFSGVWLGLCRPLEGAAECDVHSQLATSETCGKMVYRQGAILLIVRRRSGCFPWRCCHGEEECRSEYK